MSYSPATIVRTFTLDTDAHSVTSSPVVLVIRSSDGEVRLSTFTDYRSAQAHCELVESYGGTVLMAVEGEDDAHVGTASVWCER